MNKNNDEVRKIKSVTYLSALVNIFLSIVKIITGSVFSSISLIADGTHSFSDLSTDISVLLGVHFGSKEPDESHQFGHGRMETFSAAFIAIILIIVGSSIIYFSTVEIMKQSINKPHFAIVLAAILSIISKEILFQITKRVATKSHSAALYANAWHQRSDALSSVAIVIGYISMKFGFLYGDQLAAIAVGLMIIFVGVKIIGDCFREFTEASVDTETIDHIKQIVEANESVRHWHKLRTRMVGREVFLDLHILVDPDLNITDAHNIAENLENTLHHEILRPVNITIHIEPDTEKQRR